MPPFIYIINPFQMAINNRLTPLQFPRCPLITYSFENLSYSSDCRSAVQRMMRAFNLTFQY